jgi:hypothetical protein
MTRRVPCSQVDVSWSARVETTAVRGYVVRRRSLRLVDEARITALPADTRP